MDDPLISYLHDRLGGAQFAVALLNDLSEQETLAEVSSVAKELLPKVEQDRLVLERLTSEIGEETNPIKEGLAWLTPAAWPTAHSLLLLPTPVVVT